MTMRFDIGVNTAIVSGESVDEFHEEMKQALFDGFQLYSAMFVSGLRPGKQVISQLVQLGRGESTYMLIVADDLSMLAERLEAVIRDGWQVLWWHVEMDGKFLQWVMREQFLVGNVLLGEEVQMFRGAEVQMLDRMPYPLAGRVEAVEVPFDGVFVRSIRKLVVHGVGELVRL